MNTELMLFARYEKPYSFRRKGQKALRAVRRNLHGVFRHVRKTSQARCCLAKAAGAGGAYHEQPEVAVDGEDFRLGCIY